MKKTITMVLTMFVLTILVSQTFLISAVPSGDAIDKITFIHYKDGKIKQITNNAKPAPVTACYKLLGVKWPVTTLPVTYVINPTNSGLDPAFLTSAISTSTYEWDKNTNRVLFNNAPTIDESAVYNEAGPDYKNSYVFGEYSGNSNVIAVTNIWYTRLGKAIVDYDVLFNTYYTWGDAKINPALMDLQNIATHETGHGIGLADLYNSCVQETMYGYSNTGETSKRDLFTGDIAGVKKLYG